MPGCVLRVASTDFKLDDFLSTSTLHPYNIYRRGEAKGGTGKLNDKTGMTVIISDADGDELGKQVQDAMVVLDRNRDEIRRLQSYVGSEEMVLDFGVWSKDVFVQYNYFPPLLLRLAGELGVGIELSIYQKDEECSPQPENV
jgi:hypothetical protein